MKKSAVLVLILLVLIVGCRSKGVVIKETPVFVPTPTLDEWVEENVLPSRTRTATPTETPTLTPTSQPTIVPSKAVSSTAVVAMLTTTPTSSPTPIPTPRIWIVDLTVVFPGEGLEDVWFRFYSVKGEEIHPLAKTRPIADLEQKDTFLFRFTFAPEVEPGSVEARGTDDGSRPWNKSNLQGDRNPIPLPVQLDPEARVKSLKIVFLPK